MADYNYNQDGKSLHSLISLADSQYNNYNYDQSYDQSAYDQSYAQHSYTQDQSYAQDPQNPYT